MLLFPAIDIYNGCAVRLKRGDYQQMTTYSTDPAQFARKFEEAGATCVHLVDLEGAKTGETPNLETVRAIAQSTNLFCEIGGGIRSRETIETYLAAGVDRVILGTAAVENPDFLRSAVREFGAHVAVGVDVRDGLVAVKGWTETSALTLDAFCAQLQEIGVDTIIVTDISKDGMLGGTNRALYERLSRTFAMNITASGGVSTLDDVRALRDMNLYGAIIGKAYYEGLIDLSEAIRVAHGTNVTSNQSLCLTNETDNQSLCLTNVTSNQSLCLQSTEGVDE